MQIILKLALDAAGIECKKENYQKIADFCYLAKTKGVDISPSLISYDSKTKQAFSRYSHESGGNLSWNLFCDVDYIERDLKEYKALNLKNPHDTQKFYLPKKEANLLKELGKILETKTLEELIGISISPMITTPSKEKCRLEL